MVNGSVASSSSLQKNESVWPQIVVFSYYIDTHQIGISKNDKARTLGRKQSDIKETQYSTVKRTLNMDAGGYQFYELMKIGHLVTKSLNVRQQPLTLNYRSYLFSVIDPQQYVFGTVCSLSFEIGGQAHCYSARLVSLCS